LPFSRSLCLCDPDSIHFPIQLKSIQQKSNEIVEPIVDSYSNGGCMRSFFRIGYRVYFCGVLGLILAMSGAQAGQPNKPTLTAINPASGTTAGATNVTLTGTNFIAGATVDFGGAAGTNIVIGSTTSLTCDTPAHAAGQVTVTVTTSNGSGALANGFTYADPGGGGGASPFRFLTTTLARATRSSAYSQLLLVANAGGEVTFAVESGQAVMTELNLTLDPKTGLISGIIPSAAGNASGQAVQFSAFDGTTKIIFDALISTTSAGGSDFGFTSGLSLPAGEIEKVYTTTVTVVGGSSGGGLASIRFGATDLPPGISMNGLTGEISGTPSAAGTFYVTITATDQTDSNKAIVVLPLLVLPKNSDFKFGTVILDNGEVGLDYGYQVVVSGGSGNSGVTYSAAGLPPGLTIAADTGLISGKPTAAGTYLVVITASKANDTISINRPLTVVTSGSVLYWFFSGGLATAFLNQSYSPTSPPITLAAHPFTNGIVYSATGLPPGMSFDSASGALTGTPTEVGIYPVLFSATDSSSTITFTYDFVVLPPNGGDSNSLPINLWVKKAAFKRGSPGKDAWAGQWIYNADRRRNTTPVRIYDASTDPLAISLGSIPELSIPRASLTGARPTFSFKGTNPAAALKLDESNQTISLSEKSLTITDTYKSTLRNTVKLGTRIYRLDLFFDDKGKFTPALGLRKTAFVAASAKLTAKAAGKDAATFAMYLGDPAFTPPSAPNDKTVRFRVSNSGGTVIMDKDFTAIVSVTSTTDKATGAKVYKLKSGKDTAAPTGKLAYDSKSGKFGVALKGLTLGTGLPTGDNAEEQLSIEVTISKKQYFTGLTVFAPKAGAYSTKLPK
jgi:hypothetical protein